MLIVKIFGGLGNQMFQYAAAKALAIEYNLTLRLDVSVNQPTNKKETTRKYGLYVFDNIFEDQASPQEINSIVPKIISKKFDIFFEKNIYSLQKNLIREKNLTYSPIIINNGKGYLDGYWQSENYFYKIKNELRQSFDLTKLEQDANVKKILKQINNSESVSLHIRRGDYITNKRASQHHGVCTLDYYYNAINEIIKRTSKSVTFFVFSDDLDWCKANLSIAENHIFVKTANEYSDLHLMSKCKHNIIANSSFSWWGAWLNSFVGKICIAPNCWFVSEKVKHTIIPLNWKKL